MQQVSCSKIGDFMRYLIVLLYLIVVHIHSFLATSHGRHCQFNKRLVLLIIKLNKFEECILKLRRIEVALVIVYIPEI